MLDGTFLSFVSVHRITHIRILSRCYYSLITTTCLILIITSEITSSVYADSVDYCALQQEKCRGDPHIGCETTPTFEINPICENIQLIPLTNRMKNVILKVHNDLRNKLAGGLIEGYPTASAMLEMVRKIRDASCEA